MSKTKNKTSSEIRHLLGENKRLQKQVKRLERMLEKYTWLDLPVEVPLEPEEPSSKVLCTECSKGELEVFEIIGRVYTTCKVCGDRKRTDG